MRGSRRLEWILIAGLLLLAFVAAVMSDPEPRSDPFDFRRSTYHDSPAGTRALYLTLRELEIPVGRRHTSLMGLDSFAGALALLAPSSPPTPGEAGRLARWVERGGTLIYAAGGRVDPVLDSLGLRLVTASDSAAARGSESGVPDTIRSVRGIPKRSAAPSGRTFSARAVAHEWTRGIQRVDGFHRVFDDSSAVLLEDRATPLLVTSDDAVAALTFRLGEGRVVAWSGAAPLANDTVRESGGAVLFARTADAVLSGGERLVFDEYHQGYRGGGSILAGTGRFLTGTAIGHGVLQLAAVGLLLLFALGRRFGAPITLDEGERRSPLEHVEALAEAYRQASARTTARRWLLTGFARRLRGQAPGRGHGNIPRPRGPALERGHAVSHLLDTLERKPNVDAARVASVRAELAKGDRADLVALARDTDQLLREVHGK